MSSLFSSEVNLQISRLSNSDALLKSDLYNLFRISILRHEEMYPKISNWFEEKVKPGIINGTRIAYLGFCNDNPIVTAVVKIGKSAKFCHLNIDKNFQDQNVGELFFSMMVLDVRHIAKNIHFTLPESLWDREQRFFTSFGFESIQRSPTQYRKLEMELSCNSTFEKVWDATLEKLPKLLERHTLDHESIINGLLMSIRPQYLSRIFNGDKVIEIRKKFNHKWSNRRVTLYSTNPTKAVVGNAKIHSVISDSPDKIWEDFGEELGCTKSEYDVYVNGLDKIFAIKLSNVNAYQNPIYLTQLSWFLDKRLVPPQSYASLKENKNWLNAISIAELLQGKLSTMIQTV